VGEGRRVVAWTTSARDSLDEILSFIASDSPEAASKVLEVVVAAAESLSLFSERGRVVPETDMSSIREIFVYRYRVLYQVLAARFESWPFFTEPWTSRIGCNVVVEPSNRALQRPALARRR
jgi:toxin ParE1/3/4